LLWEFVKQVNLTRDGDTASYIHGVPKKTDTQFYFWDNFGNSAPILTILSLLQADIYGA